MAEPQHPHANHRARLRERFLRAGLSDFAPHNVLELLLFYAIPRRDTNPIAHALLARFGSVGAVLGATESELLTVKGVGAGVVGFFAALRAGIAQSLRCPVRTPLRHADTLGCYLSKLLEGEGEGAVLLFLDNDFCEISHSIVGGSVHSPRFSPADVARRALLCHAPMCAVAHHHVDGLALPTAEDLDLTRQLRNTLEAAGVRLLEHYIVGGGRFATLLYRHSGSAACAHLDLEEGSASDGDACAALAALFRAAGVREDAAALLAEYGDLYHLFAAPTARHLGCGMAERTAALLALVTAVDAYCAWEMPIPRVTERERLGSYLARAMRSLSEERVYLLLFGADGRHLATHTVGIGGIGEAGISCRRIAEGAFFAGARQAVLVHNHPRGNTAPSEEDRAATDLIARTLGGLGVSLLCHYVVAWDDFSVIL